MGTDTNLHHLDNLLRSRWFEWLFWWWGLIPTYTAWTIYYDQDDFSDYYDDEDWYQLKPARSYEEEQDRDDADDENDDDRDERDDDKDAKENDNDLPIMVGTP